LPLFVSSLNDTISQQENLMKPLTDEEIASIKDSPAMANWYAISSVNALSEPFIREFKDYVDWPGISQYQVLSERFIREFADKVVWSKISRYQVLSEEFISEFKDKVHWENISCYQVLSESFILKFTDKMEYEKLMVFQTTSAHFKDYVLWRKYQTPAITIIAWIVFLMLIGIGGLSALCIYFPVKPQDTISKAECSTQHRNNRCPPTYKGKNGKVCHQTDEGRVHLRTGKGEK
jgi:hypothetical protein